MSDRTFPIQRHYPTQGGNKPLPRPYPTQIPWSVAELAYSVYRNRYGDSQSLERLAQRGGFGPFEMDDFLPDWRERSEIATLRGEQAARVMPLIGPLLDAWEHVPNDERDERLAKHFDAINKAIEGPP